MKHIAWLLVLLSVAASARVKSLDEYPLVLVVKTSSTGANSYAVVVGEKPKMTFTDGHVLYNVACKHLCLLIPVGMQIYGRVEGDKMAVICPACNNYQTKRKFTYLLESQIPIAPADTSTAIVSEKPAEKPCKTYVFNGREAVCSER